MTALVCEICKASFAVHKSRINTAKTCSRKCKFEYQKIKPMPEIEWLEIAKARLFRRLKINQKTGCWEWQGFKGRYGHGQIRVKKIAILTHRLSWKIHKGAILDDLLICHHCDNPPCVNPEHLFSGTVDDNKKDMDNKGRGKNQNSGKVFCHRGHKFDLLNTYISRGERQCIACRIINKQNRKNLCVK